MGVMRCNRNRCENIMCDRYSGNYGHICEECFKELLTMGIDQDIGEFMKSRKVDVSKIENTVYRFFNSEFELR